jgi:hypothetical protein
MARNTALVTMKDLPKLLQKDTNFLNAGDISEQETPRGEAPAAPRPEPLPGRRPLFRN